MGLSCRLGSGVRAPSCVARRSRQPGGATRRAGRRRQSIAPRRGARGRQRARDRSGPHSNNAPGASSVPSAGAPPKPSSPPVRPSESRSRFRPRRSRWKAQTTSRATAKKSSQVRCWSSASSRGNVADRKFALRLPSLRRIPSPRPRLTECLLVGGRSCARAETASRRSVDRSCVCLRR